uniref:NADH dehydrogenase [ubiquinone] 1 beta subcomplex subunit 6 n=1 Tax=Phocoena sinus TaxID=42100 RepID=A0A8C9ECM6_PHOSS
MEITFTTTGCTSHEKLRPQQLLELRRRRLKDQELSRRVNRCCPGGGFCRTGAPWKNVIYKTYRHSIFPRIFLGDTILETGEVIPPRKEFPDQHH